MKRWLLVGGLALFGCGGGGAVAPSVFSSDWQSDAGESIAQVERRVRSAPRPADVSVVVGVTADGLSGAELPSGKPWQRPGAVDSVPSVAPDGVVLASGGGQAFALDGRTGQVLWTVSIAPLVLRGGADDGHVSVLSLGKPRMSESRLVAVDRAGKVVLSLDSETELGRPAVRDGIAFVPWGGQYVSAIDVKTGSELGRLLTRDLPSYALDVGGNLYFGQYALVKLDDRIKYAESFQATRYMFKPRELPGHPVWLGNGLQIPELDRTARAKIRLFAAPVSTDHTVSIAGNSYAGTYFRAVYGFALGDGHLLWADALAADVVGGGAAASGFVFCDQAGKVHFYDAKGGGGGELDLGQKLVTCAVGATALDVSGTPRGPLAKQIEQSFEHLDPDMAAAEGLLIAELGKLPDEDVTRILIELAQDSRVPPNERQTARHLLSQRKNGADFMLAALEHHYDFVSGEQTPPVGPLADALRAIGDQRAAPLLARHLNDPADSIDDVARAAHALEVLATPSEVHDLTTFFALYRATADEPELVQAVLSVAVALLRVGGASARELVDRAVADPLTRPDVQNGLAKLVAAKPSASAVAGQ